MFAENKKEFIQIRRIIKERNLTQIQADFEASLTQSKKLTKYSFESQSARQIVFLLMEFPVPEFCFGVVVRGLDWYAGDFGSILTAGNLVFIRSLPVSGEPASGALYDDYLHKISLILLCKLFKHMKIK